MAKIDLAGKPICITGASSGIGLATARACARAGMPVVLAAREEGALASATESIVHEGGRAVYEIVDVQDKAACERMVERCASEFGSVYAVFANAGYGFEVNTHDCPDDRLRHIFETNFFGMVNAYTPAIPRMLEAGAGHVLVCSSCIGKLTVPFFGPYCATKGAQYHLAAAMSWELGSRGVHVSSVHPVGTKTSFFDTAKQHSVTSGASLDDHAPEWLMQTPETVGRAIVKCLRRPKREVWPSWAWTVRLGMGITTAFPGLADFWMRKMVAKQSEAGSCTR